MLSNHYNFFSKEISLIIVIFISPFYLLSQKIEKYYSYNWKETAPADARFYALIEKTDSGWHRNDYFLATKKIQMTGLYDDSICKVPNGTFYYFYPGGKLQQYGQYTHGKKRGLWLQFHTNGMMADSTFFEDGHPMGISMGWHDNGFVSDSSNWNNAGDGVSVSWFDNGNISSAGYYTAWDKRRGKWQFFHNNGKISSYEVYDNGKPISKDCFDENGKKSASCLADTSAQFHGGNKAWQEYLSRKLYFPPGYKFTNTDAATVVISFVIDEDGNVKAAYVYMPLFREFDQVALDVIKKSPRWIPAIEHNRKIKYHFSQPIIYMQDQ